MKNTSQNTTKVRELMNQKPILVGPDETLQEAARKMKETNCGVLPVGSENNVQGIITDRDIIIRAISAGKNPATEKVGDYMTTKICACSENDSLTEAAETMHENDVSRLVVTNDIGKVCGILSFGHILRKHHNQNEVVEVVACATGKKVA